MVNKIRGIFDVNDSWVLTLRSIRFINLVGLSVFLPVRKSPLELPKQQAIPPQSPTFHTALNMGLKEDSIDWHHKKSRLEDPKTSQILQFPVWGRRASITEVAEALARESSEGYDLILQEVQQALMGHGTISGRVKSPASIRDKLIRLAQKEGVTSISKNWAKVKIQDSIGFRLILKEGSVKDMDRCIQSLAQCIQDHRMQLMEIRDYHGPYCPSYLSAQNLETLLNAQKKANGQLPHPLKPLPIQVTHQTATALKLSGYTALQLKVRFRNETLGELQIRGPQVDQVANVEHLVYDIRQGKSLSGKNVSSFRGLEKRKLETLIQNLSSEQTQDYMDYLAHYYQKARMLEVGEKPEFTPVLADSLRSFPQLALPRINESSFE
jgi:ppGpp synthetase/RelA/SpoT-type nucleotidyltranferase